MIHRWPAWLVRSCWKPNGWVSEASANVGPGRQPTGVMAERSVRQQPGRATGAVAVGGAMACPSFAAQRCCR